MASGVFTVSGFARSFEIGSPGQFLIYGATGYTGRLTTQRAIERGLRPVLAGRDPARLRKLADPLGLEFRVAAVEDRYALELALQDVGVVLNIAGPMSRTAAPVVEACLQQRVHYLDVTGELEVFVNTQRSHGRAVARDVMLMPGVGFAVVPSDCLAAHVAEKVPDAVRLSMGMSKTNFVSRGSAKTMIQQISNDVPVRRNGELIEVPFGSLERYFDYGHGPRLSTAMGWADVFTAYHSTGIPNIEVYLEANALERTMYQSMNSMAWLLRTEPWQTLLKLETSMLPEGPVSQPPDRTIVAECTDGSNRRTVSRLSTVDGYDFTAISASAVVERVLGGDYQPGYQTPAKVYGPDFVLELDTVTAEDIEFD